MAAQPRRKKPPQLHAVEGAVVEAKRGLIHDHIDHCAAGGEHDLAEIKALTELL
jgi:DNA-binding FrmR family transcriptional regulator